MHEDLNKRWLGTLISEPRQAWATQATMHSSAHPLQLQTDLQYQEENAKDLHGPYQNHNELRTSGRQLGSQMTEERQMMSGVCKSTPETQRTLNWASCTQRKHNDQCSPKTQSK